MFISSFAQSFTQYKSVDVSQFMFPKFTQGLVLMKSGETQDVLLNYNLSTEEMIYIDKETKLAISNEALAKIDTIFVMDKKFVVVGTKFFELMHRSKFDLYVEHKCKVNNSGSNKVSYDGKSMSDATKSYTSIDMAADFKLPPGYEIQPYTYYWIMKTGISKRFINMRQLEKMYSNKKALFKAYVKQHNIAFENKENIIQFIEYLESN